MANPLWPSAGITSTPHQYQGSYRCLPVSGWEYSWQPGEKWRLMLEWKFLTFPEGVGRWVYYDLTVLPCAVKWILILRSGLEPILVHRNCYNVLFNLDFLLVCLLRWFHFSAGIFLLSVQVLIFAKMTVCMSQCSIFFPSPCNTFIPTAPFNFPTSRRQHQSFRPCSHSHQPVAHHVSIYQLATADRRPDHVCGWALHQPGLAPSQRGLPHEPGWRGGHHWPLRWPGQASKPGWPFVQLSVLGPFDNSHLILRGNFSKGAQSYWGNWSTKLIGGLHLEDH